MSRSQIEAQIKGALFQIPSGSAITDSEMANRMDINPSATYQIVNDMCRSGTIDGYVHGGRLWLRGKGH